MTFKFELAQVRAMHSDLLIPENFDAFWNETLVQARNAASFSPRFAPVDTPLRNIEVWDVTYPGYAGHSIKGWLLLPRDVCRPLPCIVEFVGYGGGRGYPAEWLLWVNSGYAHFVMDTRGQGSGWRTGNTPDLLQAADTPHQPGFMTRGITDPEDYYYRRLITDAVLAVDVASQHPDVDSTRIVARGTSQGGGIALAVSALHSRVAMTIADVPFLCNFRQAVYVAESDPYLEIVRYLRAHRDQVDRVFRTLAYFDGVNFARHGRVRALFSVALMDTVCPPSTVYAAFNAYAGEKQIIEWEFNNHESGQIFQFNREFEFLESNL